MQVVALAKHPHVVSHPKILSEDEQDFAAGLLQKKKYIIKIGKSHILTPLSSPPTINVRSLVTVYLKTIIVSCSKTVNSVS